MSQPLYALGDIHGQFDLLQDALAQIEHDGGRDAAVVFIGDLTDRGPDSRKVIDLLIGEITAGRNWIVIKGNHDRMFGWFMQDHPKMDPELLLGMDWLVPRIGGRTTLASLRCQNRRYMPVLSGACRSTGSSPCRASGISERAATVP